MLFSSLPFLFGFLPLILALTYVTKRAFGPHIAILTLLTGSLFFYAWQTPIYIFLILGSIITNYGLGRLIGRTPNRGLLFLGVSFNLALLIWFKYIGLFSQTLSDLVRADLTVTGIALPLAISFYTFQQIAYLVDCWKQQDSAYGFLDYAMFVAFFPQLIAGPIVHHSDSAPQFRTDRFASFRPQDIAAGLMLFTMGLSKKILLADNLAPTADYVFDSALAGDALPQLFTLLGVLAYSFQIYFDFSGYSDMAIGLGLLFGILLPMNFDSPYKARSISEFWRKWHMTLSQFLRDYLYFPLGGNRKGKILRYRNLFIVMLLGGLWHGAAWTFLVWGGLHGLYLCINHAWRVYFGTKKISPLAVIILTFIATALAWVFFRAESFSAAWIVLSSLTGTAAPTTLSAVMPMHTLPLLLLSAFIIWRCPNSLELLQRSAFSQKLVSKTLYWPASVSTKTTETSPLATQKASYFKTQYGMVGLGVASAISIFVLLSSGPYEFIYFQF